MYIVEQLNNVQEIHSIAHHEIQELIQNRIHGDLGTMHVILL